ncbi:MULTISPECIES: DUF1178 family protein [unclassified Sphingomonas]|uniref:DUF1178 family protein n=1 Tax=unclassified Sphingomonas TaxID=196159 RepID=UPI000BC6A87E|nr:MAG: hypothetical protein B7Z43_06260 [Sphingomonas sp. 12-62-6]OYX40494.1 MAG: hypothetical protein B7Y98_01100 [Sphingomonas sp. 32-62-10]
MIVFDLRCSGGHVFEAWFASSTAYEDQRARSLVVCPVCDDATIEKAVMAPNIAAKGNRSTAIVPSDRETAITKLAAAQAKLLEQSEWVGRAFPDRARAMHLGDEPAALIHGETSMAEAVELAEEGVPLMPLPFKVVPPSARN